MSHFKKFQKDIKKNGLNKEFYDWLLENTDYIEDYEQLKNIYNMFDLTSFHENIQIFDNIKVTNGPIIKNELYAILENDGFIIHF
jgi:phosphoglucomutase